MTSSLGHRPAGPKWEFDPTVTAVFEDMLRRSILGYEEMRALVATLVAATATECGLVVDLGTSQGEMIARLEGLRPDLSFLGLEVSPSMLEHASLRFADRPKVEIRQHDLRDGLPDVSRAAAVVSVLTLMFVPVEYRPRLVRQIYDSLEPGGAFVLIEKVLGDTPETSSLFTDLYYRTKAANGYSREEIDAKRRSLEGVLVPLSPSENERLLQTSGFRTVELFWRYLNFAGWVAFK